LECEKLAKLEKPRQLDLIYYQNTIPLAPILRYLKSAFEEVKTQEIKILENLSIKFTEPVVDYDEFAARIGVSTEAVKAVITGNPPIGYVALPNFLVSKEKLTKIDTQIKEHLRESGKLSLTEATRILEKEGISDAAGVLATLGYKITWHGISSEQAEVSKTTK
jgi:hypothetical protein